MGVRGLLLITVFQLIATQSIPGSWHVVAVCVLHVPPSRLHAQICSCLMQLLTARAPLDPRGYVIGPIYHNLKTISSHLDYDAVAPPVPTAEPH
jgi:hypothetical protein